jgi:hydroxymethylbilane synthase
MDKDKTTQTLTIGTRTSELAQWQTNHIISLLQAAWTGLKCNVHPVVTKGDKSLDRPLPEIGGKGLFTAELEEALHAGVIDCAVHSLKDLPVENAPGLILGAVTARADTRDCLVGRNGWTLSTLPAGAVVGTSSLRRKAQIMAVRPDLIVRSIRGNVETRVRKVANKEYDAAVLAAAGLQRLQLTGYVTEWLEDDMMLPAPGQAALAIQCRADDEATLRILAAIDDAQVRAETTAERIFLQSLGGGCSAPIAAHAKRVTETAMQMQALIATPEGGRVIRVSGLGDDPAKLGRRLALEAEAEGAGAILAALEAGEDQSPLQGMSVVVTRPQHQASELTKRLDELGATSILFPTIQIVPMPDSARLDAALTELGDFDWVIFTSVNGVEAVWERMGALGLGAEIFSGVRVSAIGPATGGSLVERGVQPGFIPDEYVAERIAEGLGQIAEQRVLLPRAEIARKTLAEMLIAQGALVEEIPAYRTILGSPESVAFDRLSTADIYTFTSSSTVRNFVELVGGPEKATRLTQKALVACIGPITARTAQDCGMLPDIIADDYTMDGLVAAIVDHLRDAS